MRHWNGHGDMVSISMPQCGEELEYLAIPDLAFSFPTPTYHLYFDQLLLVKTFLLFCCFCCEVQELSEDEALERWLSSRLRVDRHVVEPLGIQFNQENECVITISIAELKVFTDTWDGSWDIPYPDVPISLTTMTQHGQVRVDLEDPAALATFLVTANIKLIRAEWLGDAPDAISRHTTAGRLYLRKLAISAISKVQCKSNLNFGGL